MAEQASSKIYDVEEETLDNSKDVDIIRIYQKEIDKIPIPDPVEIRQLAEIIQSGKNAKEILDVLEFAEIPIEEEVLQIKARAEAAEIAKKRLVTGHLRFAAHVARLSMGWVPFGYKERDERGESVFKGARIRDLSRFASAPLSLGDRIQMANIGLMKAAENYKPDGGASFTTYAMYNIETEIQRAVQKDRNIKIPVHIFDALGKVAAQREQTDSPDQVFVSFVENYGDVDYRYVNEVTSTLSLEQLEEQSLQADTEDEHDEAIPAFSDTVKDRLAEDMDEQADQAVRYEIVRQCLESFPARERKILELRYPTEGEPWTLEGIGHELDLTRERVRQLEGQALARLGTVIMSITSNKKADAGKNTLPVLSTKDRIMDSLEYAIDSTRREIEKHKRYMERIRYPDYENYDQFSLGASKHHRMIMHEDLAKKEFMLLLYSKYMEYVQEVPHVFNSVNFNGITVQKAVEKLARGVPGDSEQRILMRTEIFRGLQQMLAEQTQQHSARANPFSSQEMFNKWLTYNIWACSEQPPQT